MLTVRNRLEITKKCIEALYVHTKGPFELYVYNNLTDYIIKDHFDYFQDLYSKKFITQLTFNTDASSFGAFSKAMACNQFGLWHRQDPKKDSCSFLVFLDNDIIVTPNWDIVVKQTWRALQDTEHIKIVGQYPGGIMRSQSATLSDRFADDTTDKQVRVGYLGGSGLWTVRPDFFEDVGFLPVEPLIGMHKKHDQLYWPLLEKAAKGKPYILGIEHKLGIHCGLMAGSVCKLLSRNAKEDAARTQELIQLKKQDENIKSYTFEEFYRRISTDNVLMNAW